MLKEDIMAQIELIQITRSFFLELASTRKRRIVTKMVINAFLD